MSAQRRAARAAAVAALALCLLPASAVGAQPAGPGGPGGGGVAVTPAVVERDLPGRSVDRPFTLSSTETVAVRVALRAVVIGQEPDGTLAYGADHPGLRVTPAEAVLEPGGQVAVRVTGAIPAGQGGLYGALLATPSRLGATGSAAPGVHVRTRVAAPLLLRGPRPWRESLEITDITLTPTAEERVYRVGAALRNTGDVHQRVTGEVRISEPGGPLLGTATLGGGVILPGAARRLDGGLWTAPVAPGGTVRAEAEAGPPPVSASRDVVLLPPLDGDGAGDAEPASGLPQPGGGGGEPDRRGWLALFALALLLVTLALLLDQWRRHGSAGAPAAQR